MALKSSCCEADVIPYVETPAGLLDWWCMKCKKPCEADKELSDDAIEDYRVGHVTTRAAVLALIDAKISEVSAWDLDGIPIKRALGELRAEVEKLKNV